MTIRVKHRSDGVLENEVAARESQKPKRSQVETYIDKYVFPAHKAIVAFINEHLIGKEFADLAALEITLGLWPDYYRSQVEHSKEVFATTRVDVNLGFIFCPARNTQEANSRTIADLKVTS